MQARSTPTKHTAMRSPEWFAAKLYLLKFGKAADGVTASKDTRPEAQAEFPDLIVAIARDQDRAAFARLFEHFAPRIKALMMQLGTSPARAEEIAQDTMLAIWIKAALFDPAGASASGWIYRIAKNLHLDALRRDRRLSALPAEVEPEDAPQPDAILSARDTERRVQAAIAALSPEQLRVITLAFFEDKPHAEIAKELSIPLGTVKSRVRLAMQRLRDLLDGSR
jgi:RNA polymerase sigma-70 factor (ECF subfamily)